MKSSNTISESTNILAKKSNQAFFEGVFKLYYDKLLYFAWNYLNSKEDAEEVIQELFLKFWQNIDRCGEITNLNSYLFKMTKNACLDKIKHKKIVADFAHRRKLEVNERFIKDEAAHLLLENELKKVIDKGIESLPAKCKQVFLKSRFEGLKNREIAKELSISKKTVDNQISKALSILRIHLKEFISLLLLLGITYH
ncbi:RNA polymerase sigma-70 factor [Croceitalea sp. MTPC9]|uniref:RNA polymerase sigma-70 factor n=1 Tax=unclassified Croceitalea TaxID=2632280 RepID=UPI002B3C065E|nr:RNA polymerase sigma-70 factor [Croceitalea sp. MTPC6]GMN16144.1 RNA polymerase sigma-70 factor [Croceitalea sp. MTPC9]